MDPRVEKILCGLAIVSCAVFCYKRQTLWAGIYPAFALLLSRGVDSR
jgi:hypothetical protein